MKLKKVNQMGFKTSRNKNILHKMQAVDLFKSNSHHAYTYMLAQFC